MMAKIKAVNILLDNFIVFLLIRYGLSLFLYLILL
jgi:hypothetical protein